MSNFVVFKNPRTGWYYTSSSSLSEQTPDLEKAGQYFAEFIVDDGNPNMEIVEIEEDRGKMREINSRSLVKHKST